MNKKQTGIMLSVLGILSLVLITAGVTFAFFNYAKEGTTENTITTGSITFIYEEVDKQGSGISIENAFPVSDEVGKAQSATGEVFNFKVQSENGNFDIPYTVTARMSSDSTLDQKAVKVYLTEVVGDTETALTESIYEELSDYANAPEGKIEKVLYTDTVEAGATGYEKNYRLRMWIPDSIDFSPVQDAEGNDTYPYNGKKFTLTVNVYANAEVVSVPDTVTTMTSEIALSIGDAVTATDGSKWHVLEASAAGTDTVVLLSDYNLDNDGSYLTECQGSGVSPSLSICNAMAFNSTLNNVYDGSSIANFINNTYEPLVTVALPGTTNVTLPEAEQIAIADGQTFNPDGLTLTNLWLVTTNYWTKTADETYSAIAFMVYGALEGSSFSGKNLTVAEVTSSTMHGARPVITTLKTNLISE